LISPPEDAALDRREEMAELEVRIEKLAEALERCRKLILAAKISIVFGALLTGAALLGVLTLTPDCDAQRRRRPARRDRRLRFERLDVG
jgi:hypothetical protein